MPKRGFSFRGIVKNARFSNAPLISQMIAALEGKRIEITIREVKSVRSNLQNNYWWGVVIPPVVKMFRKHGTIIKPQQAHDYLKEEVLNLSEFVVGPDGAMTIVRTGTSDMTTNEFSEAVTIVQAWAMEMAGVYIPDPNEYLRSPECALPTNA